ncbi:hypothetical protein [Tellurirhabdus rosea]|uniref:hypothetical protein n=1 Tax=Tellurirhabdus rosea TaxID=2674997 RepID=UPI002256404E|nr:hypothetical protein [Tellurirhabdus rosea]
MKWEDYDRVGLPFGSMFLSEAIIKRQLEHEKLISLLDEHVTFKGMFSRRKTTCGPTGLYNTKPKNVDMAAELVEIALNYEPALYGTNPNDEACNITALLLAYLTEPNLRVKINEIIAPHLRKS